MFQTSINPLILSFQFAHIPYAQKSLDLVPPPSPPTMRLTLVQILSVVSVFAVSVDALPVVRFSYFVLSCRDVF